MHYQFLAIDKKTLLSYEVNGCVGSEFSEPITNLFSLLNISLCVVECQCKVVCSAERLNNLVSLYHAVEVRHIEVLDVAEAGRAIRLVAEHAEEAFLVSGHDSCASEALDGLVARVRADHALTRLELVAGLESLDALRSHAKAESLLRSAQSHQVLCEELENLALVALQSSHVLGLEALVVLEVATDELLGTQLALHHDLGAITLDVLEELGARHMLIFFLVADVATKLGALDHGVLLKLKQRLPDDLTVLAVRVASVRELAEVNAVAQNFVDFDDEVTALLAVGATDVEAGRQAHI